MLTFYNHCYGCIRVESPVCASWHQLNNKPKMHQIGLPCTASITANMPQSGWLQIRPLEEAYKFGSFFSSLLTESDFEAKPSVLLLGQYSTGKTTFIKHLLGRDYPGIHIGPEPTTGQPAL